MTTNKRNMADERIGAIERIHGLIHGLYREMLNTGDAFYSVKIAGQIVDLQKADGSWSVIERRRGDSDIIVEYVYFPTYYATAALMRCSLLTEKLPGRIADALHRGLAFAQGRRLNGHGYDSTEQKLKALHIYKQAGLYEWMMKNEVRERDFCGMLKQIIEGFRNAVATGHTFSDWARDFRQEFEHEVTEYDESMCPYVWYAAYGSNLSRARFMKYIEACSDKSEPEEERPYQIPYELYFAIKSSQWNRSGVAFIDEKKPGRTMGKIYKIRRSQFREIQSQEGFPYRHKVMLGALDGIPVYSFSSPERPSDVNVPCKEYLDVVLTGLKETYPEKAELAHSVYLFAHGILIEDDIKVLSFLRTSAHGQSISQITGCGLAITRVKKSVKALATMGLVRQDSRSVAIGDTMRSPEAVFYTVRDKRELIDILLEIHP